MRPDDLEFLIAQYADGSLDAKRSADLEAVLRRDAAAQAILDSYRAVDGLLAGVAASESMPQVQWDRFAAHISRQVSSLAAAPELNEKLEEQISRLSSGDLSPQERSTVEAAIAVDPQSRLVLGEYQSLDRTLDAVRQADQPQVRWPAFAQHVSTVIDRADDASSQSMRIVPATPVGTAANRQAASTGVAGRIGRFFAQPRRLAVAACVLLAASISLQLVNRGGNTDPVSKGPGVQGTTDDGAGGTPVVTVVPNTINVRVGPSIDVGGGSTITNIEVGPPDTGFDMASLAEWAREQAVVPSQSSIGKATTRPDDKVDNTADSGLFPPR